MTDDETLGKIKKAVSEAIESPPMGFIPYDAMHIYLVLQILDRLDKLPTKFDVVNANLAAIEHELEGMSPL